MTNFDLEFNKYLDFFNISLDDCLSKLKEKSLSLPKEET